MTYAFVVEVVDIQFLSEMEKVKMVIMTAMVIVKF